MFVEREFFSQDVYRLAHLIEIYIAITLFGEDLPFNSFNSGVVWG